mgnify:CR=1 FL=1
MTDPQLDPPRPHFWSALNGDFDAKRSVFAKQLQQEFPGVRVLIVNPYDQRQDASLIRSITSLRYEPDNLSQTANDGSGQLATAWDNFNRLWVYVPIALRTIGQSIDSEASGTQAMHLSLQLPGQHAQDQAHLHVIGLRSNCTGCQADGGDYTLPFSAPRAATLNSLDDMFFVYHEIGHMVQKLTPGSLLERFRTITDAPLARRRSEQEAEIFANLMMVREGGELGLRYAEMRSANRQQPDTPPPYLNGGELTAATAWAKENMGSLRQMSMREVFTQAQTLYQQHAMPRAEYLTLVSAGSSASPSPILERLTKAWDDRIALQYHRASSEVMQLYETLAATNQPSAPATQTSKPPMPNL